MLVGIRSYRDCNRLHEQYSMKDEYRVNEFIEPQDIPASPEHILWLAVIERAISDYIGTSQDIKNDERRSASWFLFCQEPFPCNLAWISLMLYGDKSMSDNVAKQVKRLESSAQERISYQGSYRNRTRTRRNPISFSFQ